MYRSPTLSVASWSEEAVGSRRRWPMNMQPLVDEWTEEAIHAQRCSDAVDADIGGSSLPIHPWLPVHFASRSPGSRVFPSAVVSGNSLYIFGGHDGGVYRNDLLVFNLETRAWLLDIELKGSGVRAKGIFRTNTC